MSPVSRFRVELYNRWNDLAADVEVISVSSERAGEFAKTQFFSGEGWEVVGVTWLRHVREDAAA